MKSYHDNTNKIWKYNANEKADRYSGAQGPYYSPLTPPPLPTPRHLYYFDFSVTTYPLILKFCDLGDNKFQVMIFLSRLPDKTLLFFGSVDIM